jgi:hypothetical protein
MLAQSLRPGSVPLLAGVLLLVTLVVPANVPAEDVRDFAGFYKVGEITDLGDQVTLPLTVRIFNYSGAEVIGARIILEDSLVPGEDRGSFAATVDLPDRESAAASDTFTVPRHEYEQWQEGAHPWLRLEFTDAAGTKQRAAVALAPMLIDEQEQ